MRAEHQADLTKDRRFAPVPQGIVCAAFSQQSLQPDHEAPASPATGELETAHPRGDTEAGYMANPSVSLARSFLRLADLPNSALDRLSRYEAALWRQIGQTLFTLDALDRRKPQERGGAFRMAARRRVPVSSDRS
jgi:hypothetical protein